MNGARYLVCISLWSGPISVCLCAVKRPLNIGTHTHTHTLISALVSPLMWNWDRYRNNKVHSAYSHTIHMFAFHNNNREKEVYHVHSSNAMIMILPYNCRIRVTSTIASVLDCLDCLWNTSHHKISIFFTLFETINFVLVLFFVLVCDATDKSNLFGRFKRAWLSAMDHLSFKSNVLRHLAMHRHHRDAWNKIGHPKRNYVCISRSTHIFVHAPQRNRKRLRFVKNRRCWT